VLTSAAALESEAPNVFLKAAGTGTLNRVSKWLETGGAGTLGDSAISEVNGRVGFNTSNPGASLHISGTATQDLAAGMGPDLALGPAFNFGYAAATFGRSAGFFNVRPDAAATAPNPSLRFMTADVQRMIVTNTGNVGIGTGSPDEKLHVEGSDGDTTLKVEETNGTATAREMVEVINNGDPAIILKNSASADRWSIGVGGTDFLWNNQNSANTEMQLNGSSGNLAIEGLLSQGSSRTIKTGIAPVNAKDVLARVAALPLAEWQYKTDLGVRHVGPMAEDFYAAFGFGADDAHISPSDQAGVALAAVQALNQAVSDKNAEISELKARLAALEAAVRSLAPAQP
ncbi:MAG: tail fiber domain-containing protein, partial [Burkholderiales bacterium]